jgi:hypothetical protein
MNGNEEVEHRSAERRGREVESPEMMIPGGFFTSDFQTSVERMK